MSDENRGPVTSADRISSLDVIRGVPLFGISFAMFGELQRYQLYYVVFGIWIFQLSVSPIWLKYYRFGPLEWLWR